MTINEIIDAQLKEVSKARRFAQNHLKNAPKGSLSFRNVNGNPKYYCRLSKTDTNGQYLSGNANEAAIKALEEKNYCLKLEAAAIKEEEILFKIKSLYESMPDCKTVFNSINAEKRHLIKSYDYTPDNSEKTKTWLQNTKKRLSEPSSNFVTQNGEYVRSKSELIIADRLKAFGVPYRYESPTKILYDQIGEIVEWYPDFKVLNERTGQQFLWEHFGMLDNPDYCDNCQFKLETYAANDYFVGKNLIVTSESSKHEFNTKYVDCLIREYLL